MTMPRLFGATFGELVLWVMAFWLGTIVLNLAVFGTTMVWIALLGGPVIALLMFHDIILVLLIDALRNRIERRETEPKPDPKLPMTVVRRVMPLCAFGLGFVFSFIFDQHS